MTRRSYVPGDYDLQVRRSFAGLGLFTESAIAKNQCVIEYTGRPLSEDEEAKSRSRYLFEVTKKKTIDGAPRSNTARYINHSCRPNCEPFISKGRVYIFSRRAIKPGEELSYDYGKDYVTQFFGKGCLCPKCGPATLAKRKREEAKAAKAAKSASR